MLHSFSRLNTISLCEYATLWIQWPACGRWGYIVGNTALDICGQCSRVFCSLRHEQPSLSVSAASWIQLWIKEVV